NLPVYMQNSRKGKYIQAKLTKTCPFILKEVISESEGVGIESVGILRRFLIKELLMISKDEVIEDVKEKHGRGLLINLHEHEQSENIKLGYTLSKEELMLSDEQINQSPSVQTESSIKNLYLYHKESLSFAELLRGKFNSLGGKLQSYSCETTPHINQCPKDEKLPRKYRPDKPNKESREFLENLADSIIWFLNKYFAEETK
ncbi:14144_t:CDS:2, partial [Cetraspora pellucida]